LTHYKRGVPTTLRIALLSGLLALLSNLAVIGFIYWRTHDEAVTEVRQQVIEQGKVLADVYRSGGRAALIDAVQDTIAYADPDTAVAILDSSGHEEMGNVAGLPRDPFEEGYRSGLLRLRGQPTPRMGAIVMHRLPTGQWVLSGHVVGQELALRDTLERSLIVALLLAGLLGLAGGAIVARYVGGRVGNIVAVARRISRHDLSRRVPLSGRGDAFDRLGQQINAMLDRIEGLMDELRMLTDSLAHDLRSPVSRLRSAAHAAAETGDPNEQEELLGSVIRQADSLMRILSAVLEISRSEALTGRKQFAWFDLGALASELTEMYEPLAEEAGARLDFRRPTSPIPFYGHRQLLAQAISNLVENAVRYGSEGGQIEIEVASDGRQTRIDVADRGPGIPDELYGEALRRFGRLDSSRSEGGAGLGLALAKAIAHLHDGQLRLADNEPGLRASLQLPVRANDADSARAA
jgi:signal transduction histidine kinase